MALELSLPPQVESALRARAAAAGVDIASFVRQTLEEKLASATGDADRRTLQQWMADFDAWINRPRPVAGPVDDSRESIYEGRGG